MPIPSPVHARTAACCHSLRWKDWGGYAAVCAYDHYFEQEYFALRHAAGLVDVSPLNKYDVRGPDAAAFLSYVMVRDVRKLKLNQVWYTCWCDADGKLVDDGTVWRLQDERGEWYRVTSSEPAHWWLTQQARGFDVEIRDVSAEIAALSVQGPNARDVLRQICDPGPASTPQAHGLDELRYFWLTNTRIDGVPAIVTRTGYTGDLGYEVWVAAGDGVRVWDAIFAAGRAYGLQPVGLDAQDITRIEAAFILAGVDYLTAPHCLIESRKSTPLEIDFGWMLNLEREAFLGQAALQREKSRGPLRMLAGLELDWDHLTALFAAHDLPPEVAAHAWRDPRPVYVHGRQVGYATSGAWSPLLKKNLALATVGAAWGRVGTELTIELTVEYVREQCRCRVVERPFLDLERKKSVPKREPRGAPALNASAP